MSNLRQAMNRGAFDFVLKPIDFQDLDRTLDKTLRHVRAARRALRWAEENEVLRLLLGSGGGERVAPALQAAGWLSGEHLQATVVHVRLAGAAARPPVERLALLNRAFDIILPEISAYRGVVERLSGDAAVALFQGDNHQQRALLSCFSLREQAQAQAAQATTPADWDLAIGADTGAVLTGRIGARAAGRADLALLGEPVERAARLAALAAPGQILISGALLPALSASCEIERMPAEPPDGPEAYRVLSPHQTWISTAQTRIL
jgi:class 3 adenylate cyclase